MTGDSHSMPFAGIPHTRVASGTAWQPDDTPMHAWHRQWGEWSVMTHFNAFLSYDYQDGPRGDDQVNSVNWLMLMASRRYGDGELTLRTMLSLEPATTTREGYPLLLQTGEALKGAPLIDRQHPHDLFMELAALYRQQVADRTVVSLYVAASGEPALGPPGFPHRLSAMDNPAAPVSHHWQDATHITFGVVTLGVSRDKWQVEASAFNGREPNDDRWDIDHIRLDSAAARISYNPTPAWSLQGSYGYLHSPEALHADENVHRATASVMHMKRLDENRWIATTLVWGTNHGSHAGDTHSLLLESTWKLNPAYSLFGRAEYVEKPGEDLGIATLNDGRFGVGQITLGALREFTPGKPCSIALGASLTYSFLPDELEPHYGDHPFGCWVFLRIRPAAMKMQHHHSSGMAMSGK